MHLNKLRLFFFRYSSLVGSFSHSLFIVNMLITPCVVFMLDAQNKMRASIFLVPIANKIVDG